MDVLQTSILNRTILFLLVSIFSHGSFANCQTETPKTQLTGTLFCDQSISFEDVILKASYVKFRKKYSSNITPTTQAEELPPTIPVDAAGEFSLSRIAMPIMFHCTTSDKTLAGSAQVDELTATLKIKLEPVATIRGKLIDHKTEAPLANRRLIASVRFVDAVRESNSANEGSTSTETDEDGNFEFTGLVFNRKYNLSYIEISPENHISVFWLDHQVAGAVYKVIVSANGYEPKTIQRMETVVESESEVVDVSLSKRD